MNVEVETPLCYCCFRCGSHICFHNDIVDTRFQLGEHRAFLFYKAANVCLGENETRQLITGPHVIADVSCFGCKAVLGWKYQKAFADVNRWKEGKLCFVLRNLMLCPQSHP